MGSIENKIQTQVPLYPLTTFRIGGRAKFFLLADNLDDLQAGWKWAMEKNVRIFIMSGGSNILVNDSHIDGLVIRIGNRAITAEKNSLVCGAGAPLSGAVSEARDHNLTGLEWAIGIPGSVGGAVRGNAGAYGGSMSDVVDKISAFNPDIGEIKIFVREDCGFRYRDSCFASGQFVIWEACLSLAQDQPEAIRARMDQIITKRTAKIPREPSAGSVFKNLMHDDLTEANLCLAGLAVKEGRVKGGKVPSAWIIDMAGLKGKRIGGAEVSRQHANFIVNMGDATASDVVTLISFVKQQVRQRFNIELMEEIQYFGF